MPVFYREVKVYDSVCRLRVFPGGVEGQFVGTHAEKTNKQHGRGELVARKRGCGYVLERSCSWLLPEIFRCHISPLKHTSVRSVFNTHGRGVMCGRLVSTFMWRLPGCRFTCEGCLASSFPPTPFQEVVASPKSLGLTVRCQLGVGEVGGDRLQVALA